MTGDPERRFRSFLSAIRYRDGWDICLRRDGSRWYLQVRFKAPDIETGKPATQYGRKWLLSPHMCESEIVTTAFKACLAAEEHECKERFRYRGQPVFTPHLDVNRMALLMEHGPRMTQVRPAPPAKRKAKR